jgi:serpin B
MHRLLAILALLTLGGCIEPESPPSERTPPEVAAGDALALLPRLWAEAAPTENIVYSPVSTAQALGLVHLGARGETQLQIAAYLGIPAGDAGDRQLQQIRTAAITGPDEQTVRVKIANALFLSDRWRFEDRYVAGARSLYAATAAQADFAGAPAEAAEAINRWADEATEGMIANVVDVATLNREAAAYLANATFFEGSWRFDFRRTDQRPFLFADGRDRDFAMMSREGEFAQVEAGGWKAVRLAYSDERFAMDVMLPQQRQPQLPEWGPDRVAELHQALSAARPRALRVHLPRFQAAVRQDLKPPLRAAGLTLPFDPERADLSGMSQPGQQRLYIDEAFQVAKLEVFETGTRAAAATIMVPVPVSAPPPFSGPDFVVDHPFLFAIRDLESGAVLFFGRIMTPERFDARRE